jgi:hypothetical protein
LNLGNCFTLKLYKSQLKVIEQALETASLMLGSDNLRGYCLEMVSADFLAGVNLENGDPEALLLAIHRLMGMLTTTQRQQIFERVGAMP